MLFDVCMEKNERASQGGGVDDLDIDMDIEIDTSGYLQDPAAASAGGGGASNGGYSPKNKRIVGKVLPSNSRRKPQNLRKRKYVNG